MVEKTNILNEQVRATMDEWMKKYPPEEKQSAVFAGLRAAQEANGGYLTVEFMDAVADYLEMPKVRVYEVATFYSLFNLKPVGKYTLSVCTNISCQLCGCEKIVSHLEKKLGIKVGETTADQKYTLKSVECLAACAAAPVMQVNDKTYYEYLTPEKVDEILKQLDEAAHGQ